MLNQIATVPLQKILFIDEPFVENNSPKGERSRFLWSVLSPAFDADLLLLKDSAYKEIPVAAHSGFDKQYSLSLESQKVLIPESFHKLAKGQNARFINILDSKRYELIVVAGLSCLPLAQTIKKTLPNCIVVIDIDCNCLPSLDSAWNANKKPENALALWNLVRQKAWNKFLINSRFYYLFANPADAVMFRNTYKLGEKNTALLPLPINISEAPIVATSSADCNSILFWGDPAKVANLEVGRDIVSHLYPRISKKLVEKNITVVLCGGEELQAICGGRIIYAPFEQLSILLPKALFVLLPLNEADNEGRILRSGEAGKAIICSQQAVSSWSIPEDCYLAEQGSEAIGNKIIEVLRAPKLLEQAAQNLQQYCLTNLCFSGLKTSLLTALAKWMEAK